MRLLHVEATGERSTETTVTKRDVADIERGVASDGFECAAKQRGSPYTETQATARRYGAARSSIMLNQTPMCARESVPSHSTAAFVPAPAEPEREASREQDPERPSAGSPRRARPAPTRV